MKKVKPVPRVEKYVRKDGTPVHRERHQLSDIPITIPTREEFEQDHLKVLLKLTPKRDLDRLEKHFKGGIDKPTKTVKTAKTFQQYIIGMPDFKKDAFAMALKKEFEGARGIKIRRLIDSLVSMKYLIVGERERKDLFQALQDYFGWYIGSRQSIFDPKPDEIVRDPSIEQRIRSIYKSLK